MIKVDHLSSLLVALAVAGATGAPAANAALAPAPPAPTVAAVNLYAAPNGTGEACTQATPCSLATAKTQVQQRTAAMTGDIVVNLAGGTYPISTPLTFGAVDSGKNGHTVTWRNQPGKSPVLSGGRAIKNWTAGADGIWSADSGGANFRQLYGTGQRFQRARTPNNTGDNNTYIANTQRLTPANSTSFQFKTPDSALPSWDLPDLTRVEVVSQSSFTQDRYRVKSVSANVGGFRTIDLQSPDGQTAPFGGVNNFTTKEPPPWGQLFLENDKAFLDQPGEWYLDTDSKKVYLMPPAGTNPNTLGITAPATQQLVAIAGASNITFHGLQFAYTNWSLPDTQGNMQRQGGFHVQEKPNGQAGANPVWYVNPGAINLSNSSHITFERNDFRYLGANAIVYGAATHDNFVVGDIFTQISDSAVFIGSPQNPNQPAAQQNRNETVSNNFIDHMGMDYATDSGITATFPNGFMVAHNQIQHIHNIGINIGYITNLGSNTVTSLQGVHVVANRLDDICTTSSDCGAVHTKNNYYYTPNSNAVPQSTIDSNYVTNVPNHPEQSFGDPRAFYLDNDTNHVIWKNNQWADVHAGLVPGNDGPNNVITNNGTGNQAVIKAAGLQGPYKDLATLDLDKDPVGG